MPRAQIVGVPAISDPNWSRGAGCWAVRIHCGFEPARFVEVPRLSILSWNGLGVRSAMGVLPALQLAFGTGHGSEIVTARGVPRLASLVVSIWKPL